jgi:hypothetical protein
MNRDDLVLKLVSTGHLNVEERNVISRYVTRDEVRAAIRHAVEETGHFPPHARPWTPGSPCFEGWQLARLPAGVRLLWQRSHAVQPSALAESTSEDFSTVNDAIEAYVTKAVVGTIDGVEVRVSSNEGASLSSLIQHAYVVVTADNLDEVRARAPDLIAHNLEPGCLLWTVPSKRRGHVAVIWPEKAHAALGYEWDECIMFGTLRVDGDRLLMVEGRSRQSIDLNHVPKM